MGRRRASTAERACGARTRGFSLIEVLVIAAIVAILATIAYPAYQDQMMKTRRSTAKAALSDAASRQEQYFLNNKTYADSLAELSVSTTTDGGFYTLDITAPDAACPIDRCYRMSAAPEPAQSEDSCGTLAITSDGVRTPDECWP